MAVDLAIGFTQSRAIRTQRDSSDDPSEMRNFTQIIIELNQNPSSSENLLDGLQLQETTLYYEMIRLPVCINSLSHPMAASVHTSIVFVSF
jgi:hypothetical protein